MSDASRSPNVPRDEFDFRYRPETDQSFENALAKARDGERLTVDDGVELLTTGTDRREIDPVRKEQVLEAADRRRAEVVGDEVTFVANLNNNVTTACNTGCLFCNFKDRSEKFRSANDEEHGGFTKTPAESRRIVEDALETGIYEVTSVSGLHPAFALDDEHREILESSDREDLNYRSPGEYDVDPGTYCEQMEAMSVGGVHLHSMTPEEAYHARRGTDWSYEEVYGRLKDAGLDSVPGTAAEILVDEVRAEICPGKIRTDEWLEAMEAGRRRRPPDDLDHHVRPRRERDAPRHAPRTAPGTPGPDGQYHRVRPALVHSSRYAAVRARHGLRRRDHRRGRTHDRRLQALSRQYRPHPVLVGQIRRRTGPEDALLRRRRFHGNHSLEEITKRAGGGYGEARSFAEYVEMITAIGRTPVERSTDYEQRRRIDPDEPPFGPELGPQADGTPLVE